MEVDGAIHDTRRDYDTARTESLEAHCIRVIRFRNEEVLEDLTSVLHRIQTALTDRQSRSPLSRAVCGGGAGGGGPFTPPE